MIHEQHIRNLPLSKVHQDTIERWGVSYARLAELIPVMDRNWGRIKRKTLKGVISYLRTTENMSRNEAIVMVQLYHVLKQKLGILLN